MVDAPASEDATLVPKRPGERLRDARLAQGLDLGEVAARTRVPLRHLEAIEASNYSALPSVTYAMGFTRAYARAVGVDEVAIARDVRAEVAQNWDREPSRPAYDITDPARTPSPGIVVIGIVVAVLVVAAMALWFGTDLLRGGAKGADAVATAPTGTAMAVPPPGGAVSEAPAPSASGQVALTATDTVWVRIYDAADTTLLMKEMAPGERYDLPAGADRPMINVGRPDKLAVTINGANVAPLGSGRVAIKDVQISAAALLARAAAAAGPAASPTSATPAVGPSPAPTATASPRARPTPGPTPTRAPALPPAFAPPPPASEPANVTG